MSLSQSEKEVYANFINVIFQGALNAKPYQITEKVVENTDSMYLAILGCSTQIKSMGFDLIYTLIPIRGVVAKLGARATEDMLKQWVMKLTSKYQFLGCLNQAKASWRTAIQHSLMGL